MWQHPGRICVPCAFRTIGQRARTRLGPNRPQPRSRRHVRGVAQIVERRPEAGARVAIWPACAASVAAYAFGSSDCGTFADLRRGDERSARHARDDFETPLEGSILLGRAVVSAPLFCVAIGSQVFGALGAALFSHVHQLVAIGSRFEIAVIAAAA